MLRSFCCETVVYRTRFSSLTNIPFHRRRMDWFVLYFADALILRIVLQRVLAAATVYALTLVFHPFVPCLRSTHSSFVSSSVSCRSAACSCRRMLTAVHLRAYTSAAKARSKANRPWNFYIGMYLTKNSIEMLTFKIEKIKKTKYM